MRMVVPKAPFLFLRIYVYVLLSQGLLCFVSIDRLLRYFSAPGRRFLFRYRSRDAQRLLPYIRFVLSHVPFSRPGKDCLVRSFILFCFLNPGHDKMSVVIGVFREKKKDLAAHCWLEEYGRPMFDSADAVAGLERIFVYP